MDTYISIDEACKDIGCTEKELALLTKMGMVTAGFSNTTGEILIKSDNDYKGLLGLGDTIKLKCQTYMHELPTYKWKNGLGQRVGVIHNLYLLYARGAQRTPYRIKTPDKFYVFFDTLQDAMRAAVNNYHWSQRDFSKPYLGNTSGTARFTKSQSREMLNLIPNTVKFKHIREKLLSILNKGGDE